MLPSLIDVSPLPVLCQPCKSIRDAVTAGSQAQDLYRSGRGEAVAIGNNEKEAQGDSVSESQSSYSTVSRLQLESHIMITYIRTHKLLVAGVVAVLAVPLLALAWWLGSPLFIDDAVDEQFPLAAMAEVPDTMSMADAEATMVAADAQPDLAMDEVMVDAMGTLLAPEALRSGQFRDADSFHTGTGTATIWDLGNDERALRFEEFRVRNGPDLRVFLAVHPDPMGRSDVLDGGYVEISALKGNVGNQNYDIPPDVDLDMYNSVVIFCWPFRVVFSVAPLS